MAVREQYIDFATHPERYKHWKLQIAGRIATLAMDVQEDAPLVPGYELKLNSYDLGVDIELYDAVQHLRFEHPEVAAVVITSPAQTGSPHSNSWPPWTIVGRLIPTSGSRMAGPIAGAL